MIFVFDYVIKNGKIIDGSGVPAFAADIAIEKGKIAAIAERIDPERGSYVIDAQGRVVTPGFIDTHRHADAAIFRPGFGEAEIRQGITTIVNGNCGQSMVPCPPERKEEIQEFVKPVLGEIPERAAFSTFREYRTAVQEEHLPLHVETLIGNGTASAAVRGYGGVPTKEEKIAIRKELEKALSDGACGVSIGLGYSPECLYDTKTMIELLRPLCGSNKPLTTHIRGEGDSVLKAIREVVEIARTLDVKLEVNHLKCIGKRNWGSGMKEALAIMDRARADGVKVACDVYPYIAGSTQLMILMPNCFKKDGTEGFLQNLRNPEFRKSVTRELTTPSDAFENIVELVGWEHIRMSTLSKRENKKYEGLRVTEIAKLRGQDPFDCAYDMLIEENGTIAMTDEYASEEDVEYALKHPMSSIISDAIYPSGILHPRVYGTYPRVIEEYVRNRGLMSLEEAVRKMTYLPARIMNFETKGLLRRGYDADLLVFDPARIHTGATFERPDVLAEGIEWSFVSGKAVIENGAYRP